MSRPGAARRRRRPGPQERRHGTARAASRSAAPTPGAVRPWGTRREIGVDVGGTFTDLILVDEETGRITVDKVPSTPDDPARGTVAGVEELCRDAGIELGELDAILHGTTVATNIVLTHSGAESG